MKIESLRRPWSKTTSSQGARNNDSSFYRTTQWRNTRAAFLISNPNCTECGQKAEMVDHKTRILDGGSKLDRSNLQSMCNKCHASKSAKERNQIYKK